MPPPNTTDTSAIDMTPLPYSNTQQVDDAGTTYTVWYKHTATITGVLSVFAFGDLTTYRPLVNIWINDAADVYDGIFNYPQKPIYFPVDEGVTYWFQIVANIGNPAPANLAISLQAFPASVAPRGSIFINDATYVFPAALLSSTTGQPLQYISPFPGGERMAQQADGTMMVEDIEQTTVKLFTGAYALLADVGASYYGGPLSSDRSARFYAAPSDTVTAFSSAGAVLNAWTVAVAPSSLAPARDNTILYYADGTVEGAIRRWNLVTDSSMSDLVAGIPTYIIKELFVLGDGTILAVYRENAGIDVGVRRYDTAGTLLNSYETQFDASIGADTHLAISLNDPADFWAWIKIADGYSRFMRILTSSGTVAQQFDWVHFSSGSYDAPTSASPVTYFGHSESCTFLLTPAGVPPTYTTQPRIIRRLRRAPHLGQEQQWMFYSQFQLDLETGIGAVTGQGVHPQVMLRWSDDGGHTWTSEYWVSAGALGRYAHRAIWRRLGRSRDRVFEVVVSDPVAWNLLAAYLQLEQGTS